MTLFLYQVSRTTEIGYDEYDSFIVAAIDEDTARRTPPSKDGVLTTKGFFVCEWSTAEDEPENYSPWPDHIKTLAIRLIGTAVEGIEPGVILVSFRAG